MKIKWNARLAKWGSRTLTCAMLVVLTGCETRYGTPDRTATGALTGGAIGVASGALIGGRHAGEGALIGGALGAVTGGLIGHSMDQQHPIVVAGPPPPPPAETMAVAPGPGYVWMNGEWVWNGGWVWVGGHWIVPPYPHAVWVNGYWGRGPHGYRRVPGHWG